MYIEDVNSKFGTFKRLDGPIEVSQLGDVLPVQIEKKCFFFRVENRFSAINSCCYACFGTQQQAKSDAQNFDHFVGVMGKYPTCSRY